RLACAVGAEQAEQLATPDLQVHPLKRDDRFRVFLSLRPANLVDTTQVKGLDRQVDVQLTAPVRGTRRRVSIRTILDAKLLRHRHAFLHNTGSVQGGAESIREP